MPKSKKKVFSIELFTQTLEQEKAEGIIRQIDIDFALDNWARVLAGKTADEIAAEGGSTTLKDEWFVEEA